MQPRVSSEGFPERIRAAEGLIFQGELALRGLHALGFLIGQSEDGASEPPEGFFCELGDLVEFVSSRGTASIREGLEALGTIGYEIRKQQEAAAQKVKEEALVRDLREIVRGCTEDEGAK